MQSSPVYRLGRTPAASRQSSREAEELALVCVRVDLWCLALQGQYEDAPALLRVNELALLVFVVFGLFDEVQAILHEARRLGQVPLASDRAAVHAGEGEDLQPAVAGVADEELLANSTINANTPWSIDSPNRW